MEKITLAGIDSICDTGTHGNAMDPTAKTCEQKEGMQVCIHTHTHTHTWIHIQMASRLRSNQEEKEVQRKSYCFLEVICGGVDCNLNVMLVILEVTIHMQAGMASNCLSPC